MPLQVRKPKLTSLIVPSPSRECSELGEDVRTPVPHTPLLYQSVEVPLVMTPDTPSFDLPSPSGLKKQEIVPWSEEEDALLISYLSHPPRPLRTTYPPNSLPPPAAIDDITSHVVSLPTWSESRTWSATRSHLFDIARKRSATLLGGPRRQVKETRPTTGIMSTAASTSAWPTEGILEAVNPNSSLGIRMTRLTRPRLAVLGGAKMSRQQHSMDSLYGDAEVGTFSEALRLSSTLQDTASSESGTGELTSTDSLSSPLAFTFTFNPPPGPPGRRKGSLPTSYPPFARPTSLLQRGRSFTSHDLPGIPSTIGEEYAVTFDEEPTQPALSTSSSSSSLSATSPIRVRPEIFRSISSPISNSTTSPSSSDSSQGMNEDAEGDINSTVNFFAAGFGSLADVQVEMVDDPQSFTPMSPIFPNSLGLTVGPMNPNASVVGNANGSGSSDTTPNATGHSTPAITLTVDSPTLAQSSTCTSTPRLLAPSLTRTPTSSPSNSPGGTAKALEGLSISGNASGGIRGGIPRTTSGYLYRQPPPPPSARRRVAPRATISGSTTLSRSFSDGMMAPPPTMHIRFPPSSSDSSLSTLSKGGTNQGDSGDIKTDEKRPASQLGLQQLGQLGRPMIKRQRGNGPGLSVFVPCPSATRAWAEELRSPFEQKLATTGEEEVASNMEGDQ